MMLKSTAASDKNIQRKRVHSKALMDFLSINELQKKMIREKNIDKKGGWNLVYARNSGFFLSINKLEKKIIRDRTIDRKEGFSGPIVAPVARLLPWGVKLSPLVRVLHPELSPC